MFIIMCVMIQHAHGNPLRLRHPSPRLRVTSRTPHGGELKVPLPRRGIKITGFFVANNYLYFII